LGGLRGNFNERATQFMSGLPREIQDKIILDLGSINLSDVDTIKKLGAELNNQRRVNKRFKQVIESPAFTDRWLQVLQQAAEDNVYKNFDVLTQHDPQAHQAGPQSYINNSLRSPIILNHFQNEALKALYTNDAIDRYINNRLQFGTPTAQAIAERKESFQREVAYPLKQMVRVNLPAMLESYEKVLVRRALERKLVDPNLISYSEAPILWQAISGGKNKLADLLLDAGANINAKTDNYSLMEVMLESIGSGSYYKSEISALNYLLAHNAIIPAIRGDDAWGVFVSQDITPQVFKKLANAGLQFPYDTNRVRANVESIKTKLSAQGYQLLQEKIDIYAHSLPGLKDQLNYLAQQMSELRSRRAQINDRLKQIASLPADQQAASASEEQALRAELKEIGNRGGDINNQIKKTYSQKSALEENLQK
jgi:hypothetical protein